jgi:hypothetical protein
MSTRAATIQPVRKDRLTRRFFGIERGVKGGAGNVNIARRRQRKAGYAKRPRNDDRTVRRLERKNLGPIGFLSEGDGRPRKPGAPSQDRKRSGTFRVPLGNGLLPLRPWERSDRQ